MSHFGYLLRNFLLDERGATAIEYGLLAAGISVDYRHRRGIGHQPQYDLLERLGLSQVISA